MTSKLEAPLATPFYVDNVLYQAIEGFVPGPPWVKAWKFNGWQAESMSWKSACYIHAGLSNTGPISIKGPDAERYLQGLVINSFAKFPVGTMKHGVACASDGLVASHGIIERKAEDEFETFATPLGMASGQVPYDLEITMRRDYVFQIAGPASLAVLEKVTGESLRDIRFLTFRQTQINGVKTEIARIGMSGTLAYELHGPHDEGPAIYAAVYEAGKEFGIERLGWGTYLVNHVEGGFPQMTWTFVGAPPVLDRAAVAAISKTHKGSGSVDPDMRARFHVEYSDLGTEVIAQWGDHGGPIKNVRATVGRFPYLTEGRNSDITLARRQE